MVVPNQEVPMPAPEPTVELDERFSSPDAVGAPVVRRPGAHRRRRDLLAVDGAGRRPAARDATAGDLARRCAALLHGSSGAEGTEPDRQRQLHPDDGRQHHVIRRRRRRRGRAERVTDDDVLRRLAALWRSKLDWPFDVVDGSFRDPDRGRRRRRDGHVFAVAPAKLLAFGKGEPYSQTRYRFPAAG